MPIELKATAELDHRYNDAKGKPLPHPITSLVVSGELLPPIPIQHHILAALLDESNPPKVDVEFKNVNVVLTFSVTFEHEDDMVSAGKEAHDLEKEAANCIPPITVKALIERKKQAAAAQAKAVEEAKKATEAAKK